MRMDSGIRALESPKICHNEISGFAQDAGRPLLWTSLRIKCAFPRIKLSHPAIEQQWWLLCFPLEFLRGGFTPWTVVRVDWSVVRSRYWGTLSQRQGTGNHLWRLQWKALGCSWPWTLGSHGLGTSPRFRWEFEHLSKIVVFHSFRYFNGGGFDWSVAFSGKPGHSGHGMSAPNGDVEVGYPLQFHDMSLRGRSPTPRRMPSPQFDPWWVWGVKISGDAHHPRAKRPLVWMFPRPLRHKRRGRSRSRLMGFLDFHAADLNFFSL